MESSEHPERPGKDIRPEDAVPESPLPDPGEAAPSGEPTHAVEDADDPRSGQAGTGG